jgi:multisubunit Na+/H+ antiporter MnhG subunit
MTQYPPQPGMAPQYGAGAPITEDPGRTLGIVGLVVSIFASLIGLIISVIAYNKSKAAGYKNNFALAGIVIGAVFFVIQVLSFVFVFAMAPSIPR